MKWQIFVFTRTFWSKRVVTAFDASRCQSTIQRTVEETFTLIALFNIIRLVFFNKDKDVIQICIFQVFFVLNANEEGKKWFGFFFLKSGFDCIIFWEQKSYCCNYFDGVAVIITDSIEVNNFSNVKVSWQTFDCKFVRTQGLWFYTEIINCICFKVIWCRVDII